MTSPPPARTDGRLPSGPAAWPACTRASFASATALLAALMGTKVLALAASRFRFGRPTGVLDVLQGLAAEALVAGAVFLAAAVVRALERGAGGGAGRAIARGGCAGLHLLLAAAAAAAAAFSLLCAYVFWEWGGFLDRPQLEMLIRTPSPESVRWYLARPEFVFVLAALAAADSCSLLFSCALRP